MYYKYFYLTYRSSYTQLNSCTNQQKLHFTIHLIFRDSERDKTKILRTLYQAIVHYNIILTQLLFNTYHKAIRIVSKDEVQYHQKAISTLSLKITAIETVQNH